MLIPLSTGQNVKPLHKNLLQAGVSYIVSAHSVEGYWLGTKETCSYYDIACTRVEIAEIAKFARHYFAQQRILYYMLSEFVYFYPEE